MELLLASDTTSLSYWLNWRFALCALCVVVAMCISAFNIWRDEYSEHSESDRKRTEQEDSWFWCSDEAWMPCYKKIHPIILMTFRIIAFCLSLTALIVDVSVQGQSLFFYYTEWTFTLVAIYFGFGSLLSIYGCFRYQKTQSIYNFYNYEVDAEQGSYVSLTSDEPVNGVEGEKNPDGQEKYYVFRTALDLGHLFQVLFQVTAGAVVLTDCVYWCIIFPFRTANDYDLSYLTVIEHSLNAVLLLGDTALNGLRFPWFRISYFMSLTGVYVLFQWIVHASVSMWWPYPFLDLSSKYAPLCYFGLVCGGLLNNPVCIELMGFVTSTRTLIQFGGVISRVYIAGLSKDHDQ